MLYFIQIHHNYTLQFHSLNFQGKEEVYQFPFITIQVKNMNIRFSFFNFIFILYLNNTNKSFTKTILSFIQICKKNVRPKFL